MILNVKKIYFLYIDLKIKKLTSTIVSQYIKIVKNYR